MPKSTSYFYKKDKLFVEKKRKQTNYNSIILHKKSSKVSKKTSLFLVFFY